MDGSYTLRLSFAFLIPLALKGHRPQKATGCSLSPPSQARLAEATPTVRFKLQQPVLKTGNGLCLLKLNFIPVEAVAV